MATRNCLVKVIDALYDLACTTILFVDKSVLTSNKLTASQIWIPSNQVRIIGAAPTEDPNGRIENEIKTHVHPFVFLLSYTRMYANVRLANIDAFSYTL